MAVDDLPSWDTFSRLKNQSDDAALLAAKADLDQQRVCAIVCGDQALTLTTTLDPGNSQLIVDVAGRDGVGKTIRLSLEVIHRAEQAQIAPLTLVACALTATAQLDETWRPRQVGGTSPPPTGAALSQLLSVYRYTDADREIEHALADGLDVILMGEYGAGKTATAIVQTRRCIDAGYGDVWLDLTDPADGPESVLVSLLSGPRRDRHLVFIDSVQANPAGFEAVLGCISKLRDEFGLKVQILATGWPRLVRNWREPFKDFRKVTARTEEIIRLLIADSDVPAELRPAIHRLVGCDVHLTLDAVSFWRDHDRVPTWSDLQSALTEGVEDEDHRKALYWFASLGFFGLDASVRAADAFLAPSAVEWLVERGLVAHSDGRFSIPSHARARLALRQALVSWDARARWGPPEQLAWDHMQRSGERVIRATLGRLDLVGVSGDASAPFNASTRYLARAWEMFEQLSLALVRRCEDETWDDNVAAAIFAARALVVMDHRKIWEHVAAFVRRRWIYDIPGVLPAPAGEPSGESADFDRIINAMRQEDKDLLDAPHVVADSADSIDIKRFHRLWMLGLLLVFEGTAMHSDQQRLDALLATAANEIDTAGFFDPRRVPWVTARIVLGLCLAGENYSSSDVVRRACDWLRRPVSEGGPFDNSWQSGTGTWNTPEATTAMCLTALLRAGAPAASEIAAGLLWLQTREEEWTKPGREIDLALVLEAMLLGDDHEKVYNRVLGLLAWAQDELKRPTRSISEHDPEAGLRTPFVAAQLAAFVWATVTREYKALLRDMIKLEPDQDDQVGAVRIPAHRTSLENGTSTGETLIQPSPSLRIWRAALKRLEQRFVGHLQTRDNLVRNSTHGVSKEVRDEIARYQELQQRSHQLAEQVGERTPPAVLIELDRIGRQVCGEAWPTNLDVPSTSDGGVG